jgi:hypothetical protein
MVNNNIFYESRIIPGAIGIVLISVSCLILSSNLITSVEITIGTIVASISIWSLYRCFKPRWVISLSDNVFRFRNLKNGVITELEISSIVSISNEKIISEGGDSDGGIGFQNKLTIKQDSQLHVFLLPALEVSGNKLVKIITQQLPNCQ